MATYSIQWLSPAGVVVGSATWSFAWSEDEPGVIGWALPQDFVHGDYFHEPVVDLADLLSALAIEPLSGLEHDVNLVPTLELGVATPPRGV